ncbi:MAG TPA: amino acid permease [Ktedonobacteraceae bacterium]|nr:amino acid permease [Ktedonobacteraceae bacterium]
MKGTEEAVIASTIQQEMGGPLRSEQYVGRWFPRVLSRLDLLAIFLISVVFIPNSSLVQASPDAGGATYLYWILGTLVFLVPGAVIVGQLNRFMPADGSIYVWTHRALGPLWGFFAGFCAWVPAIMTPLGTTASVLGVLQGISTELGSNMSWQLPPWQQGLMVVGMLVLAGWCSTLPLTWVLKMTKWTLALYSLAIVLVGLAGAVWLLGGHLSQVAVIKSMPPQGNWVIVYGIVVMALTGVEVPLTLSAETRQPNAASLFLRWGSLFVLLAYLLGTFGVMAVVPTASAGTPFSTITAVGIVFGPIPAVLVGAIFFLFFVVATIIYNVTFARILFVSALDHRLPSALVAVNRHGSPTRATMTQVVIVLPLVFITYFLEPLITPAASMDFSARVYTVSQAVSTIIWCISMMILFLDVPVLLYRLRAVVARQREVLVASPWFLLLCCLVGGASSFVAIWSILSLSWDRHLIPDGQWMMVVSISTAVLLLLGLLGAAYPRLLSNLEEQTAAARENARLYHDLQVAYAKLRELDQLKDAFLQTASHELRTPLTIMHGYLELLAVMKEAPDELRHTFLKKACQACDELIVLQANIMDASRVHVETTRLPPQKVALQQTCMAVVELLEPLLIEQEREVKMEVVAVNVWADETRVKQVLHNLLTNALRYSPRGSPIHLYVTQEQYKDLMRVSVVDQGLGVPIDKQELIFERFVRLERDRYGERRGCGLGLAVSRQLVEAMGGTMTVQSSGIEGEGSTFSFTLPLVQERSLECPAEIESHD